MLFVIGGLAVATFAGNKIVDAVNNPTEYSGEKTYTFNAYEGLNNATMQVDRDINQVPYQEVTDHIKNMPENAAVLKDGIQVGETIAIPERAFKK